MACLFSALQVTKQENIFFSSAFLSVALSKRDQGVFKKCYFCFLLSIPTPLNVRRKVPGSSQVLAISLHLEVPFRKKPAELRTELWTRSGDRLSCGALDKLPANSPRRKPPARLHLTPFCPGAPKPGSGLQKGHPRDRKGWAALPGEGPEPQRFAPGDT